MCASGSIEASGSVNECGDGSGVRVTSGWMRGVGLALRVVGMRVFTSREKEWIRVAALGLRELVNE